MIESVKKGSKISWVFTEREELKMTQLGEEQIKKMQYLFITFAQFILCKPFKEKERIYCHSIKSLADLFKILRRCWLCKRNLRFIQENLTRGFLLYIEARVIIFFNTRFFTNRFRIKNYLIQNFRARLLFVMFPRDSAFILTN